LLLLVQHNSQHQQADEVQHMMLKNINTHPFL
jgi:hypothetical protein